MLERRVTRALPLFALLAACGAPNSGDFGEFRYVANVRGEAPLPLMPPKSDRAGNVYVLYGAPDRLEVSGFIGRLGGGWVGGCGLTKGTTFGVHGWVGRAENPERVWYWSGDALVVMGASGGCGRVLDRDRASNASIAFKAVVPYVRDAPSRVTTVAYLQTPTDRVPFQVLVDLNVGLYTNAQPFASGVRDVVFLGVGADPSDGSGVVVARYTKGETTAVRARFVDAEANTIAEIGLKGLENLPAYGIQGYLQADDSGLFAGLDVEGQLLVLDRSGGRRRSVSGMEPVGVHRWEGRLYLVGLSGGRPVVAPLDSKGAVGKAQPWNASLAAAAALKAGIEVTDDRTLPSRQVVFRSARTAMGEFPFLHAHALDRYADGTTGWIAAGPSFTSGGIPNTAIAFAPAGISYP